MLKKIPVSQLCQGMYVHKFYAIKLRQMIAVKTLDLADSRVSERIVSRENPEDWGLQQLEKLWMPE